MANSLHCPDCSSEIGGEDINMVKTIALCKHCNNLFDFGNAKYLPAFRKPEVFLPHGMEVLKLRSELEIQVNWRKTGGSAFLLFFALIWNAMLLPFVFAALLSGQFQILLGAGLHVLIGFGLIYYVLAVLFNTTFITADEYALRIEHTPFAFPLYPQRDIPVNEIKQLFVERYVASRSNGNPNYAFAVKAILTNGKRVKLVKGLKNADQARYIEQETEVFLKIQDKQVREEWSE